MRELPSGTVTFLFTDIEGSMRLLHELGDTYADTLVEHRRDLREAFEQHGVVEADTQGDAFFVAFARGAVGGPLVERFCHLPSIGTRARAFERSHRAWMTVLGDRQSSAPTPGPQKMPICRVL
jgi:class 3 adenylate cyclase